MIKRLLFFIFGIHCLFSQEYKDTDPTKVGCLYYAMKVVHYLFEKHDIKYWPSGGVLLGKCRHDSFIPWDLDIDLEIERESIEKLNSLKEELADFGLYMINNWKGALFRIQLDYVEDGIRQYTIVEILPTRKDEEDKAILLFTDNTGYYIDSFWYKHELEDIEPLDFGPITMNFPKDFYSYILRYYGEAAFSRSNLDSSLRKFVKAKYVWPSKEFIKEAHIPAKYYFFKEADEPVLLEYGDQ